MKKTGLVLCVVLLTYFNAISQVYSLNNGFTDGGQVRSCAGTFKDSNPFGSYNNNEFYKVTFNTASSTGQAMQMEFDTINLGKGDTLFIYDGTRTTDKLLTMVTSGSGAPLTISASANNASGSLTVLFKSNNVDTSQGWNAKLTCKSPCQQIGVKMTSIPAADANGFINICKGQEVTFTGEGIYSQNDTYYHQTDTTSKFLWSFSDGKDTSGFFARQVKRRFISEGGVIVQLSITDENQCYNLVSNQLKVRTSLTPTFNIGSTAVCLNDTATVVAKPAYPEAIFSNLPVYSDNKPLADGVGKCYETSININKFLPNQKLTNLSELDGILVNMEHSWLGDFTIAIVAPNGAKVYLKKSVGTTSGWETFLGEPVDEPSLNSPLATVPGKGYDYLFSPTPKYDEMRNEKGKYTYSYTDNAGQVVQSHTYLPEGSYKAEEDLAGLLGSPLNGLWTLEVCDNFKEDNGFIFYWTIKFKPSVYPDSEIYTTRLTLQRWLSAPGLVSTKDSVALISPKATGTFSYKYSATDNYGCSVDTTVQLTVNSLPQKPDMGIDSILCTGQSKTLNVVNPAQNTQYKWSTGESGVTNITVANPGRYSVQAVNNNGCKSADTIQVVNSQPVSISVGKDTMFCASSPNTLTAVASANVTSVKWNTGAVSGSIQATKAGLYWATGSTDFGCTVTDTIALADNPADLVTLPGDTSICAGTNYRLNLSGVATGVSITWNDGVTGNSHVVAPGKYSITAGYVGCSKTDEIVISPKPIPVVNIGRDTTLCTGFTLPLMAQYAGADYLWSNGSMQAGIVAANAGTYWVQTMLNGCSFRDSLVLAFKSCKCNVVMPNAFSPNGDGINDLYKPQITCFPQSFRLGVFNRYGQQVFTTTDYNANWDGTSKSQPLPVGTYYYVLTFFNIELQRQEMVKGSITLLR